MRPITQVLSAAGVSPWVPIDRNQMVANIGFGVSLSATANLTYRVEHSFESPMEKTQKRVTRSGTTATLEWVSHNLRVGDSLIIDGPAPFNGTFAVATVPTADTVTFTVAASGDTVDYVDVAGLRVFPHSTVVDQIVSADGNYAFPISAYRLNVTAYTAGAAVMTSIQTGIR